MEKEVLLKKLGSRIRELRNQKNMSQAELANTVGKDQQSIQRLEAGNINPSFYYLTEIATGLETHIEEIVKAIE